MIGAALALLTGSFAAIRFVDGPLPEETKLNKATILLQISDKRDTQ